MASARTRLNLGSHSPGTVRRAALGVLLVFIALNALGGGLYGLSGAPAVPIEWLAGSPFHDYLVPSLVLFFVVGGTLLVAAVALFAHRAAARPAAFAAGAVLLVWIIAQLSIIGYVSWLQPAVALAACIVLALTATLP